MNNDKARKKLKLSIFKKICIELSTLSYDAKHKVAAIIVTNDFREICAIGYNGNYSGGPNERDSTTVGGSGFLHAEENALFHLCKPYELRDALYMICTHKPCPMCAKRIVNSGIKTVYYINEYNSLGNATQKIFDATGIYCEKI